MSVGADTEHHDVRSTLCLQGRGVGSEVERQDDRGVDRSEDVLLDDLRDPAVLERIVLHVIGHQVDIGLRDGHAAEQIFVQEVREGGFVIGSQAAVFIQVEGLHAGPFDTFDLRQFAQEDLHGVAGGEDDIDGFLGFEQGLDLGGHLLSGFYREAVGFGDDKAFRRLHCGGGLRGGAQAAADSLDQGGDQCDHNRHGTDDQQDRPIKAGHAYDGIGCLCGGGRGESENGGHSGDSSDRDKAPNTSFRFPNRNFSSC